MLRQLVEYFRNDLAVDLGTANTRIAVPGEGIVLDEPSVVAVDKQSGRILSGGCAIGQLARQMEGRTPDAVRVVRPLVEGVVADFRLTEALLAYFLGKSQRPGWRRKPRLLVAVPDAITPVHRRALFASAMRAGARQVFLLPAAKAAAIGAGLPVVEPLASMVCVVGAGVSEVAVLSLGEVVSSRSLRVAADRMDESIAVYLRRHYSLKIGPSVAERLRIRLGSAAPLEREQNAEASGLDTISSLPRTALVTSEEIREALAEPLAALIEAIKETIDGCTPELASDLMQHGLVLAGGGALLPGLDRFVTEQTGLPARVVADPQQAVVKGLSVCAEHFQRWRGAMQSSDDDV